MAHPWERQPNETPKAYAAFCVYRRMGPEKRSLEAVAAKARKGRGRGAGIPGHISEWSRTHRWVERAAAYDDHLDAVRRKAEEKAIAAMSKRHAEGLAKIFERGLKRIEELDDERIPGGLALDLAVSGMRGERLARGLTTDNVRQEVQGDLHVQRDDGLADRILADPEATELFCRAIERAAARPGQPGIVRDGGVSGAVGAAEASEPT